MIMKWREWILKVEDFEPRGHKILIHEAEAVNKAGAISILRNVLVDARELTVLKAMSQEKKVIEECLKNIPKPSAHEKKWRPQFWEIIIKKSWPLDLADSLILSCDRGEVIGVKDDKVFVKSRERPSHITVILGVKGETWRIPLEIVSIRWIESHEIPKLGKRKRRSGSHERKK